MCKVKLKNKNNNNNKNVKMVQNTITMNELAYDYGLRLYHRKDSRKRQSHGLYKKTDVATQLQQNILCSLTTTKSTTKSEAKQKPKLFKKKKKKKKLLSASR